MFIAFSARSVYTVHSQEHRTIAASGRTRANAFCSTRISRSLWRWGAPPHHYFRRVPGLVTSGATLCVTAPPAVYLHEIRSLFHIEKYKKYL